jgi:nicotinamidase-related amidase
MTDTLRKLILDAYRENRLAHVNIDLQVGFKVDQALCDRVHTLSRDARSKNIPNIWVAAGLSRYDTNTPNFLTDVKGTWGMSLPKGRIRNGLGAVHDDATIIKCHDSALYLPDCPLDRHLQDTGRDTFFIKGVYSLECVAETIRDAVLSNRYNVVAVGDCIDISNQSIEGYGSYSRWLETSTIERNQNLRPDEIATLFADRFHMATSGFILETLKDQGVAESQASCKSAELAL